MDLQSCHCQEANRPLEDSVNCFNGDRDFGLHQDSTTSTLCAPFEREDLIFLNGQVGMAAKKKVWLPHNCEGSFLPHGGKKRRENRRYYVKHPSSPPWITRQYCSCPQGLHEEIEDFYNYMRPTEHEKLMRKHVIQAVEDVVLYLWPNAKVDVFGSFRTDLYLPTSDIDMVVFGKWDILPMARLREELIKKGVADEYSVKVLDRAAVPIIKFQHTDTKIKVDISFNMNSGVESVDLVKCFLRKFPALPKLMMVLKQFLLLKDLNEVWTGGLSSYSLLLMCVSFLQRTPQRDSTNLGVVLIGFFELYGFYFKYDACCIRVKDGGCYITKEEFRKQLNNGSAPSLLCIEDPLTRGNDLGKGTYAMLRIQHLFQWACSLLSSAFRFQTCDSDYQPKSYLSLIVNVPEDVIECRKRVYERWSMYNSTIPVSISEIPATRCSSGSSACSDVSSSELSNIRPACLSSEGYSSSSSSTESDMDDRHSSAFMHFRNQPRFYRAKSCDSLSQPHNGVRKCRNLNRYPMRMHSADNNFIRVNGSFHDRIYGSGESVSQLVTKAKSSYERENPRLLAEESHGSENYGKNRPDQFPLKKCNKSRTQHGSPCSNRGRPTVARSQFYGSSNRKYSSMQRTPGPIATHCRLER